MSAPPIKRRRTTRDIREESPLPASAANDTSTKSTSTRRAQSSKAKSASSKSRVAATKKKDAPEPAKSKRKPNTLLAFFGTTDPASLGPAKKPSPPIRTSTDDEEEDIEDDLSGDDVVITKTVHKPVRQTDLRAARLTVSKPGGPHSFGSLLAKKVPRLSPPAVIKKPPEDTRPWPEKYAPKTTADLAVNKTKVAEVRNWLNGVMNGNSRQRLLVLKGSAGTGKTATLQALSKELGFQLLEWSNPSSTTGGGEFMADEGAFSNGFSGLFEEFLGRAGQFGSLDLAGPTGSRGGTVSTAEDDKRKAIVIEDFPNTLFTSSTGPLQSFRTTIKSFLALPAARPGSPSLPPLVLIVAETPSITGPDSFTAHRLLSPEVLAHPLVREIAFNKIAPGFMVKALNAIISQDSRLSGRKSGPSKPVLETLSSNGDIRSAILGLEFLAKNPNLSGKGFTVPILAEGKKPRKNPAERALNDDERRMLEAVGQRESSFGIFHAVGKVLYNKRFGDDVEDPYVPPLPRPPLAHSPYHSRAVRVDIDSLIDECGTDPRTFVAAMHENYPGSCNLLGGLSLNFGTSEDVLDCAIACLDNLSDSDLLAPPHYTAFSQSDSRADEISFQTAVRGVMLSLPSPVKRDTRHGKSAMYYPTSARIWRKQQEVQEAVDWFIARNRTYCGQSTQAVVERMPYLAVIQRRKEWSRRCPADPALRMALDKVTTYRGIGAQSAEAEEDGEAQEANERVVKYKKAHHNHLATAAIEEVEKLVLSDDDIEEF